jgi:tyrosyl-tRNA synthetase
MMIIMIQRRLISAYVQRRFLASTSKVASRRNILNLSERGGLVANVYPREQGHDVAKYLESAPRTIYAGFDPTAKSLHVGNLLVIMGLLHAQEAGHKVIALIGGSTARIGDPSGKSEERQSLSQKEIEENKTGIENNLRMIFRNFQNDSPMGDKMQPALIVDNSNWYKDLNVVDFLATFGKHYRLGKMLSREAVKKRLELTRSDPNGGMSLSEFTYQA